MTTPRTFAPFCDALGIGHPAVLGWSFGGMVAMAYAARHPDHPAKLILQSTMARLDINRVTNLELLSDPAPSWAGSTCSPSSRT